MSASRSRSVVGLFFLVISMFVIFLVFAFLVIKNLKMTSSSSSVSFSNQGGGAIAVIEVEGVILESKLIVEQLIEAEKDKSIKAIILRINSPGGAVGPSQEIYEEINRVDETKPVFSSLGSIAASGGYYIASATRRIYTNAGTLTGSIGVIMQFMDMSKLYAWAKLKPETLKAGKYKDVGSPFRPISGEERELVEDMMAGVHQQFINHIIQERKDRIIGDIADHAQGQIFSGEEAVKRGLADEVAGLWSAGRKIHSDLNIPGEFGLKFLKPKRDVDWQDILRNLEGSTQALASHLKGSSNARLLPMFLHQ